MRTAKFFAAAAIVVGTSTYHASNWWETALATRIDSEISPDGCIRMDTYMPFWVLPSGFHRMPDPGSDRPHSYLGLGRIWDFAVFRRAYEVTTGKLIGQTEVYDPSFSFTLIYWGDTDTPGRRRVTTNGFLLVDSNKCSDEATLAKLQSWYERPGANE